MNTLRCTCGTVLKIRPEMVGKPVRCPKCKQIATAPTGTVASADPPADRPRLRSEALRAAAPVTRVEAAAAELPVVRSVAAVVAPSQSVLEPPPNVPAPNREPPACSPTPTIVPARPPRRWLLWGVGGAVACVGLSIGAYLIFRGGRSEPAVTASAPEPASETPTDEPPKIEAVPPAIATRPEAAPAEQTPPAKPALVEQPAEIPPLPQRTSGGLTGVSRQYDDLDCQRIQAQHSIRVPAAATQLTVDGQTLPITNLGVLAECPAPYLYLPRGTHAVRFRKEERLVAVTIASDLSQAYHQMRGFFDAAGEAREFELLSRGAKCLDVHSAPFLLNLMGGVQISAEQTEPGERKLRRALRINPLFAPAHLNLAVLLHRRGATQEAKTEVELADATNVGNCFGLAAAISSVRRDCYATQPSNQPIALKSYLATESLDDTDRRLVALMQAMSKYATQEAERGKILNNLATHFAEAGRTELALDHFRTALGVLKLAGPERYKLAQQVMLNMSDTCRKANYPEAEEYNRMRSLVTP